MIRTEKIVTDWAKQWVSGGGGEREGGGEMLVAGMLSGVFRMSVLACADLLLNVWCGDGQSGEKNLSRKKARKRILA